MTNLVKIAESNFEGWENFGTTHQRYCLPYEILVSKKTGKVYKQEWRSDNVKGGWIKEKTTLLKSLFNFTNPDSKGKCKETNMTEEEARDLYVRELI